MKLLVVIASYGNRNDEYLARVLSEYRGMEYDTDLVVLSDRKKELGDDVDVVVGLPTRNPMSLPFGHRKIFIDLQDDYDLFLYSEDDMLITQRNIEALLRIGAVLERDELAGFFQYEVYPDGRKYFPAVHAHFHWLPDSVKVRGEYTFARFTNEHSACYLLTQRQLKDAIASGGYVVEPHENKYSLLETATTDPYTQCGFRKFLCLSHFNDLLIAHLPNKYIGSRLGLDEHEFQKEIDALLNGGGHSTSLIEPETKLLHRKWSKDYYEPARDEFIELVPQHARTVLSIGCGWGETEASLIRRGMHVVGIPLDPVIGACAASRGVELVHGDFDSALLQLAGRQFDVVLLASILHLLPDPLAALRMAESLLAPGGALVASVPNISRLPFLRRYPLEYLKTRTYARSGVHRLGRRHMCKWLRRCGLSVTAVEESVPSNWQHASQIGHGVAARFFSLEFLIAGTKCIGMQ